MISGRDLANVARTAARSEKAIGEIYNVGTDDFGTMREAYEELISYANTNASVSRLPRLPTKLGMWLLDVLDLSPLTTFHYKTIDKDFYFDISKAKNDLDWEPQDNNGDCMRRGYEWFVKRSQPPAKSREGHRKAPNQGILRVLRRLS
jgi:nucleoside-diphosphate-sugar epimerase